MLEPQHQLGKNLVKLRNAADLTQEQLAERSEISLRYLQSLEAGQKLASIGVVGRLRAGLGCTWDDLLKGI